MVAADSPELVRPIDAWRVYDFALSKGVVSEVKFVLRVLNPHAFRALCQYEGEEIESGVSAEAFAAAVDTAKERNGGEDTKRIRAYRNF